MLWKRRSNRLKRRNERKEGPKLGGTKERKNEKTYETWNGELD